MDPTAAAAAAQAAAVIGAIKANWIVNYAAIACTSLLASLGGGLVMGARSSNVNQSQVVDYLHTLPDEIKWMWPGKWSVAKVLFLLVRYTPFLHTSLSVWHHGQTTLNGNDGCLLPFEIDTWSCILMTWICEAVSYLRVYAFSGRNKWILAFLLPFYLALRAVEIYLLYRFVGTIEFANLPPQIRAGCVSIKGDAFLLSIVFKLILASLATVTFLMIYIGWKKRREHQGPQGIGQLFKMFLQNGIVYFICLSSMAIANIIFDHAAPQNGTQYIMVQFQVHFDAILTGRMLIDLRAFANRDHIEGSVPAVTAPSRRYQVTKGNDTWNDNDMTFSPYDSKAVPRMFVQVRTEMSTA